MESFKFKDVKNILSKQLPFSQLSNVSTGAQDKTVNKNIEDLKKIPKTKEKFYKIYDTLFRIYAHNDCDAMNFAVKEKFCEVKSEKGHTIFDGEFFHCGFARFIIEFGGNYNFKKTLHNDIYFIKYIFKIPDFDVNNALILASQNGYYGAVKLFLSVPEIDVNTKNIHSRTALMCASCNGFHEVVKLLLSVPGINVNIKDEHNLTALISASRNGHYEVVRLLVSVPGIDVNAKDFSNKTALLWASIYEHKNIIKLLRKVPGINDDFLIYE